MTDFKDDILKPEEEQAGFNPGEPDDDTFVLKDDQDYPGDLPDFDNTIADDIQDSIEAMEMPETDEDISSAEQIEADQGESLWDKFEDEPTEETEIEESENEDSEEIQNDIENEPEESVENADEDLPPIEEIGDKTVNSEEIESEESEIETKTEEPEQINTEDENDIEEDNINIDNTEDISENIESEINEEEPIELDDDLKNLISQELEKGKVRKSKIKEEKSKTENIQKPKKEDFKAVQEHSDTNEIDFDKLEDEIPKQTKIDDEKTKIKEEPKVVEKVKSKKEKTKENEKKRFPLAAVITTAAATFLLTLAIGSGYLYYYTDFFDNSINQDNKNAEIAIADSVVQEEMIDTSAVTQKEEIPVTVKEDDKKLIKQKESPNKEISKNKNETKNNATVATKPKKQNIAERKKTENTGKKDKKVQKKPKKITPKKEITKNTKKEKINVNESNYDESVYIVQIYATPSEEDAKDWLEKLKNKNIENAFISTKKERGKTIYRVRFGNYKSKEEARTAALKHGFAQTWIDRVK